MEDFNAIRKRFEQVESDMANMPGLENDPNAKDWIHYGGLRYKNPPEVAYSPPEHKELHIIPMNKEASDVSYRLYIAGLKDPIDIKKNSVLSAMLDKVIDVETMKGNVK